MSSREAVISPHELAARMHDAAADAHEQAAVLVEAVMVDPSADNQIIEAQQRAYAFQMSEDASAATLSANVTARVDMSAALSSQAAVHAANAACEELASSEIAVARHRAASLAHRAAAACHCAGYVIARARTGSGMRPTIARRSAPGRRERLTRGHGFRRVSP
jgi:hypothetical protein